jgi:hypothetical protein
MRDRVRQLVVEMRAAEIAAAGDCFLATGAQFRAQLAGSDPPPGSVASALLSTDLSTCDPEAVAAVLAAAAQLQPTTTASPATIDDALPVEPGPDDPVSGEWSITWGDPSSSAAQQYVVSTENASVTNEGSVTYWHPTLGGDTPAGSPVGTIVYRIPIPGTIAGGEVHLTLTTFHWDYSQGSAAVDGSTDGTTWQVLDEIGPPAFGEANSGGLSGPLPELFSGAGEVWLRVRLVAWGPQAAGGAPWTNTSQHGRADAGAAADTFRLRVDLAP